MLRLDWQPVGREQGNEVIELLITENKDGEWVDVSERYRYKHKDFGNVYIMSLKEFKKTEYKGSVDDSDDDKLEFFNLHVLNKKERKFDTISILAKHSYLRNAIEGLLSRGEQFFILGTKAYKLPKDKKGRRTFVKYTIVPTDESLNTKLAQLEHKEFEFGENKVSADELEDLNI